MIFSDFSDLNSPLQRDSICPRDQKHLFKKLTSFSISNARGCELTTFASPIIHFVCPPTPSPHLNNLLFSYTFGNMQNSLEGLKTTVSGANRVYYMGFESREWLCWHIQLVTYFGYLVSFCFLFHYTYSFSFQKYMLL